jgi:hypothetical protein
MLLEGLRMKGGKEGWVFVEVLWEMGDKDRDKVNSNPLW